MADLSKTWLFRMLHVGNVPHVLRYGLTHVSSPNANPQYVPIGDGSLISSRSRFLMPNGKRLGAYIPFYFGVRMPMLYVIQKGLNMVKAISAEKIVYCVTSVQKILDHQLPFVFTNGHATNGFTRFFYEEDMVNIGDIVKPKDVNVKYWKDEDDTDLKRRKEAEFLVEADIPAEAILGWVVYDNTTKSALLELGIAENQVFVNPDYYF